MDRKALPKEELQKMPLLQFKGKIIVVDNLAMVNNAVNELLSHDEIGFDTETKPVFKKGKFSYVGLVQFATRDKAFLFRLNMIGLGDEIKKIFESDTIKKVGISIDDDIKALKKLSPFQESEFYDLNDAVFEMGYPYAGVKNLSGLFLQRRISKNQQVSNWEADALSDGQKRYAATDAWICLEILSAIRAQGYVKI